MAADKNADFLQDNEHFIKRSFNNYLFPSILSILGGNISIMVDNCIAGAVIGEQALAAMGIVNPIFNAITGIALLICGGASALASVSIGQDDSRKKRRYFTLAFYLLLIAAAVVTALGLAFLEPVVRLLGASDELVVPVMEYARVLIISCIAIMGVYFPLTFLRIEGKAKVSMIMFFIMAALDIILDLVFVLVIPLGMTGLALATGLSSLIAVICVLPTLFSKELGYGLVKLRDAMPEAGKIIKTGSPLALGNVCCVVRVRILNALLLSCGGSLAVAAYGCANSVNNIGMAVVSGVAQTVGPIVGVLYGERDKDGIKKTVSRAVKVGCMVTAAMWILIVIFSSSLAKLFGMSSPEQNSVSRLAISILNFSLIPSMLVNVFIYYYMTTERTGLSNLITASKGIVFNIVLSFIGARLFGFTGLLVGLALSEMLCIVSSFISACSEKRREGCDSVLLLPKRLFDSGEFLTRTVMPTGESISETAEMAEDFCVDHGLTPKQAMTVSLGIEEIMILMAKYAIGSTDECMEFRLFLSEYETVLRIRCAGKWFNPLCYEPEDEFDNLGVKMLLKMATEMSYSTNLGINNVKIIIAEDSSEKGKGQ